MKKFCVRKRILTLLIGTNILLTGCSINGELTSKKEESSSDLSYSQSSLDSNIDDFQSSVESKAESSVESKVESSVESKVESSVESKVESSIVIDSSVENSEISEEESSKEPEISEEESSEEPEISEEESSEEPEISEEPEDEVDYNYVYTDDDKYIRAKVYVNIRKEPNPNSKILDLFYEGDTLKKLGYTDDYYIVDYKGINAYVNKEDTEEIEKEEIEKEEKVKTEIDNQNLKISDVCYFPYGSTLYSDKELKNAIIDLPSLESGIIYYQDGNTYYVESQGYNGYVSKNSAYIIPQPVVVVDESDQITTLFKNNEKKLEFPVVTGDTINNTPTTKGLSEIYYVSYGATLTGPTWNVDVGVFMPFTIYGEGFHDAIWRSYYEFGGNTYQGNGSHGCVNCRYDDAMALAYEVSDSMNNDDKSCKVLIKR